MSAMETAEKGDTIFVEADTYTEKITINDKVHLIGEGAEVTFLESPQRIAADDDGIIEGSTVTGQGIACSRKSPFIKNNVIRNVDGYAINIFGEAWPTIFKNYIFNNLGGIDIPTYFNVNTIGFNSNGNIWNWSCS